MANPTPPVTPLPCSRSALDKLGKRLAIPGDIDGDDRALLDEILFAYDDQLAVAEERVRTVVDTFCGERTGLELGMTTRVKTTTTIRQKLEREVGMGLKGMHDIAGIRITGDISRRQQDLLALAVAQEFKDEARPPKQLDRREKPSAGYRALHVVVHPNGIPVEIQVRTVGQDRWAQVVERLGDAWGRGIRYGEPPPDPDRIVVGDITRERYLKVIVRWGDELDELESDEQDDELLQLELDTSHAEFDSMRERDDSREELSDMIGRSRRLEMMSKSVKRDDLRSVRRSTTCWAPWRRQMGSDGVKYFLLVYNRDTGETVIRGTYSAIDRADAMRARFAAEREFSDQAEFEVVVLGATSTTSLVRTHARYFKSKADILLNGIIPSPA